MGNGTAIWHKSSHLTMMQSSLMQRSTRLPTTAIVWRLLSLTSSIRLDGSASAVIANSGFVTALTSLYATGSYRFRKEGTRTCDPEFGTYVSRLMVPWQASIALL